ncbi:MAG: hypothetical protein N2257_03610 [Thermodesulfovibrionales bacterium]|nr:hypothetical protein [Thermodesulfovibrionales bacterium]
MNDTVYLCLDCGKVHFTKVESCSLCRGKNITALYLTGIYGGGG